MDRLGRFGVACSLAGAMAACNGQSPTAPPPTASTALHSLPIYVTERMCSPPVDTANTVTGVVSEKTSDGIRPVGEANVELFLGDSDNTLVRVTLTAADGSYFVCLPPPLNASGGTGAAGQGFELRVHKPGYGSVAQSFRYAYSVWDYGGVQIDVELSRD